MTLSDITTRVLRFSGACAFASLLPFAALHAQSVTTPPSPDTTGLAAAVASARTALNALSPLWGIDGRDMAWILTDGRAHVAVVRTNGSDTFTPVALPGAMVIANHAVTWNGRRWAMVRLPLGRDALLRTALLVHEAMHTLQPEQLPGATRTEAGTGGDFLDGEDGRTWLFLELRALGRALETQGDAQRQALRDAIVFRARRDALAHAIERERLDGLDLAEGVPEYTGFRLAGMTDSLLATRLAGVHTARVSWVRGIGYWTGPAWGYALDRLDAPSWRVRVRGGARFPDVAAQALGVATTTDGAFAEARAAAYDGVALRAREHARAVANTRRLDSLRTRFLNGPMLRVLPAALQIAFDPNGQAPLGDAGTVMQGFRWSADDGSELVAPNGALVDPMWKWAQVPLDVPLDPSTLPAGVLTDKRTVQGSGWSLTLAKGWRIDRTGDRIEVRPPVP